MEQYELINQEQIDAIIQELIDATENNRIKWEVDGDNKFTYKWNTVTKGTYRYMLQVSHVVDIFGIEGSCLILNEMFCRPVELLSRKVSALYKAVFMQVCAAEKKATNSALLSLHKHMQEKAN